MKDLSLSFLSRGCGRFVSSNTNAGRDGGRLDVCFTPQDYYLWKSQDAVLQLPATGRQHVEAESTLPKTYSTRRGPLLLYSQGLVTIETSCPSETGDRKRPIARQYTRKVEEQLSTLKELTAAILNHRNNQFTSSGLGPPFFPRLHLPPIQDLHHPSPPSIHTAQVHSSPELLVQLTPQWFPAETDADHVENQLTEEEEVLGNTKRVRLDVFLQIPCTSRSPTPTPIEPEPQVHYNAMIPEEEPQLQTCLDVDTSLQHSDGSQQSETNQHSMGGELSEAGDQSCSNQDSEMTSDTGNYENSMGANRPGLLPPLTAAHSVSTGTCRETSDRPKWGSPCSVEREHHAQRLPPIAEHCTAAPVQTQKDVQPKADRVGFQTKENLNPLHQQLLFLPLLFPGKEEEINVKQRGGGGGEKIERQKVTALQGRGERFPAEKGAMITLMPGEELPLRVGVLGCVAGRKGPGKQSSLAFLQNRPTDLQDPYESSNANRGVVKGILPLELRDLENGRSVGSLILGPDGEIIQLSLYDSSHDSTQKVDDTRRQALQVLSAEGERLPWVIVLQPEHTNAEGGVEINTDVPAGDIQHHPSIHKHLDRHRLSETNASSSSSHTDPVTMAKHKTTNAEAVSETWTAATRGKNKLKVPPLREPRGDNAVDEEDKQEEQGSTGRSSQMSGSHQPSLSREKLQLKEDVSNSEQKNPHEARAEVAVDQKRKNTESNNTHNMRPVTGAESEGHTMSMMRKQGRQQRQNTGSDTQSIRSQKQEERTTREASETQDRSGLPPVKKKMTHWEENKREVRMKEEKEERGKAGRQKEDSAGRRRRKSKHKESVDENKEKKEVEITREVEEESHLKTNKMNSATQRQNIKTKTASEKDKDMDRVSSSVDRSSSVRTVSSLRSTAAASQSNHWSLRRSTASSYEGGVPVSAMGLASSRGRLSSCSTVMITEEQLMLNPVKPESSRPREGQGEEEAAALRLAQRAERRRQEVERKRREREEEEERKQQEREQTEEKMKSELEEERKRRAEETRLKKLAEEEERRKREEAEQERVRREHAQKERERRRQEERRQQMERFQRMREEEEQKRKAELERLRLEEERRLEEESKKLQEMDESERIEYLRRKEQEEEDRRSKEEERERTNEEASRQAAEEDRLRVELLARQMGLLQQQLAFKRRLMLESGGLEKTQGISRPWIYSYFTLLQLLGVSTSKTDTTSP